MEIANTEVRKKRIRRRSQQDAPKETTFQDWFMRQLKKIPRSWFEKINDRTTIGIPDVLGGVNGYSVIVELKTKSQLSVKQFSNLQKADRAHCQSFVATPENAEEILAYIRSLNTIPPPPVLGLRKPARIPFWTVPPKLRKRFAKEP